jgi:hypothetical protein
MGKKIDAMLSNLDECEGYPDSDYDQLSSTRRSSRIADKTQTEQKRAKTSTRKSK